MTSRGQRSRGAVERVRAGVYERDGHTCVVQGSLPWRRWPCSGILTVQHAVGKGMGGSELFDSPEYLRTMCWHHNTFATMSAEFARACLIYGWTLERNRQDIDPSSVPVRYPDGHDYLLHPDLTREPVSRSWAQDRRIELYGSPTP